MGKSFERSLYFCNIARLKTTETVRALMGATADEIKAEVK